MIEAGRLPIAYNRRGGYRMASSRKFTRRDVLAAGYKLLSAPVKACDLMASICPKEGC